MNQSKICELSFDFKSIENLEVVITKITGVIDLVTLPEIGDKFRSNIPLEFDGNVIFDLSEADDQLTDDDGTKVFEQVFKARYFLRKRYAVVHNDASVNRSRKYFQAALEREGVEGRDFSSVDDAVKWLKFGD